MQNGTRRLGRLDGTLGRLLAGVDCKVLWGFTSDL